MIKKITRNLKPAAGLVAGSIAAQVVTKKLPDTLSNPLIRSAVPFVLGLVLMGTKGEFVKNIGAGMVAKAGSDLAIANVPGLAGVAGDYDYLGEDIGDLSPINEDLSPINDNAEENYG